MKWYFDWQVIVGFILMLLTALFYAIHFLLFRDLHHILIYFVGDVAFVFFEVLLITMVIHRLLHHREKVSIQKKLNMLKGAFFSEIGTDLLRRLVAFEGDTSRIGQQLAIPADWSEKTFFNIRETFMQCDFVMDSKKGDLKSLREYLQSKKTFLLDLLMNTSLHENESFTNLVWAVFHLMEELERRCRLECLSGSDRQHLEDDIKRVYHLLINSWMDFVQHLNVNYPYLHSLAVRTNPFDDQATVEVK
jgi:hypothetical protein